MKGTIKMYRIFDGEQVHCEMPINSVARAKKKGWIEAESAQRMEMPAEIVEIMTKNKKAEITDPIQAEPDPEPEVKTEVNPIVDNFDPNKPKRTRHDRKK